MKKGEILFNLFILHFHAKALWRRGLAIPFVKKTEKFLRSKTCRRVRCSAVFVCERFILWGCGCASRAMVSGIICNVFTPSLPICTVGPHDLLSACRNAFAQLRDFLNKPAPGLRLDVPLNACGLLAVSLRVGATLNAGQKLTACSNGITPGRRVCTRGMVIALPPATPWLKSAGMSTGRPANSAFSAPPRYSEPLGS